MILDRDGRTEKGHEPIAQVLIHRALVAVHRLRHKLQHSPMSWWSRSGSIRCANAEESAMVDEQHRHQLALAFERAAGRQNLLDEIRRRVRVP